MNSSAFAALTPEQETRSQALINQLRCVVCEGQPLSQSHSELAEKMRENVRMQVERGVPDSEILAYFVERYGQDILMEPPATLSTALLWAFPFAMLMGGVSIALRGRRKPQE